MGKQTDWRVCGALDFGERARDWLLAHADQFDVVHDNQTLADGILDLQRAGLPVVTTIHHPITRDLRVALLAEPVGWGVTCPTLAFFSVNAGQSRVTTAPYCDGISGFGDNIATDFGVLPSVIRVVPNGVDTSLFRPLPQIRRDPQQIVAHISADALSRVCTYCCGRSNSSVRRPQQDWCSSRPKPGGDTGR